MLGYGDNEVIIMCVLYTHGLVSVLSLDYFSFVESSSKPSNSYFTLSLIEIHVKDYLKKRGGSSRNVLSHIRRSTGMSTEVSKWG